MPWTPLRPDDDPPFMCVSCHDWACQCRSPYTIKRYTFGHTPQAPSMGATIYERGYMLPHGCQLDTSNNLVAKMQPIIKTGSASGSPRRGYPSRKGAAADGGPVYSSRPMTGMIHYPQQKGELQAAGKPGEYETYNWSLAQHRATPSTASDATFVKSEDPDEVDEAEATARLEEKYNSPQMMEAVLSAKPVSMKAAFLVSGPHWASKGHTQQWPWRGGIKCRLWSSTNKYNQLTPSCHQACWSTKGRRHPTARV